jgi:hypothetical protein
MKGVVMSLLMVFLCESILAQENFVPNGDFEQYSICPTASVPWTVNNWVRATITPDYFNACVSHANDILDTPCNSRGCQVPHSGDAYIGLFAFDRNDPDVREFIQVELLEPLVSGIRYLVEFYVSPAENYGYAVSTLGAALTVDPPPVLTVGGYDGMLDALPQILNDNGPVTDTAAWTLVQDTMLSRGGGERFISIGNFHSATDSDTLHFNPDAVDERAAYYYIDDVSVIALDSIPNSIAEPATELALTLTVWPNPATSLLHIRSGLPLARLRLLDLSGRAVHAQEAQGTTHTIPLHTLPAGLYLLEAEDTTGRKAVQRVVK